MGKLLHEDLSGKIIGCSMTVLNALRPGLPEKMYERALVMELRKQGVEVDQQRQFPVVYDGEEIGRLIPDLIVDGTVIVDAKVVSDFNDTHLAQMLGYLAITGMELSLLVNFKHAKLQWKRVVN